MSGRLTKVWILPALLVVSVCMDGCSGLNKHEAGTIHEHAVADRHDVEEKWGIRLEGVRLSAQGYMLDLRYRIKDTEKAAEVISRKNTPYLIDERTGAKFIVPAPAKVGALRQIPLAGSAMTGKSYFVLFANPGKFVKKGDLVTLVVGDFRAEGITVE